MIKESGMELSSSPKGCEHVVDSPDWKPQQEEAEWQKKPSYNNLICSVQNKVFLPLELFSLAH